MQEKFLCIRNGLIHVIRRRPFVGACVFGICVLMLSSVVYLLTRDYSPTPAQLLSLHYGDAMTLSGFTFIPGQGAHGGQKFKVLLEWRRRENNRTRYVVQVQMIDEGGHLWADHVDELASGRARTDIWSIGQRVIDSHALDLPPTMPTGDYKVTVVAYDPDVDWNLPVRNAAEQMILDAPVIAHLHVEKDKSNVPEGRIQIEQPQRVEMGDLTLLGFVPHPAVRVSRGELMHIGIYWRARVKPTTDYSVAIQLRNMMGSVLYENASSPAAGIYRTTDWDVGEVLLDWHDFPIPIKFGADPYQMFMVLRDANTQQSVGETKIMNLSVTR